VPTYEPLTNQDQQPTTQRTIQTRASASMPAAPLPSYPAGVCPDDTQQGDMDTQSQINQLASAGAGGTAGHDAAACVSARGESDGASVFDARDARVLSPTTPCPLARQVVAPQAQNCGAGAAVSGLDINPTIEDAGINTSAASTINPTIESAGIDTPAAYISKDSTKGKITAYFVKSTADGRARRSAVRGPPPPSISIPVPTPAGVAPFDAVAPPVSIPVPTPAGVAPFDAVAPSFPSVAPTALRRRTVASTNDSPSSQPTGAAPQHSTNDSPISQPAGAALQRLRERQALSKTRLYVARGSRFVASGMDPKIANSQAPPAQTSNNTIFTNDTSSNRKHDENLASTCMLVENVKPLRNCTPKQVPETKSSPKCSDSLNNLTGLAPPSLEKPSLKTKKPICRRNLGPSPISLYTTTYPTTPRFNARTSLSCRSSSRTLNPAGISNRTAVRTGYMLRHPVTYVTIIVIARPFVLDTC